MPHDRHHDVVGSLDLIERDIRPCPPGRSTHPIQTVCAGHAYPKVQARLARRRRFTLFALLPPCSRLNAVDGLFSRLVQRGLTRGVSPSIVDLPAIIHRFVDEPSKRPSRS